jgi:hypothetical protein
MQPANRRCQGEQSDRTHQQVGFAVQVLPELPPLVNRAAASDVKKRLEELPSLLQLIFLRRPECWL